MFCVTTHFLPVVVIHGRVLLVRIWKRNYYPVEFLLSTIWTKRDKVVVVLELGCFAMDSVWIRFASFDFPEFWKFLHFATLLAAWCITVIDTVQFGVYAAWVLSFHFAQFSSLRRSCLPVRQFRSSWYWVPSWAPVSSWILHDFDAASLSANRKADLEFPDGSFV